MHLTAAVQVDPGLAAHLHDRSGGARWALPLDLFRAALEASAAHAFAGKTPTPHEVEHYLKALHLDDLALAVACAAGQDAAWEHFVLQHRPALYRAADAIDPTGGARDLADSLYADLFGLQARGGVRQSLFRYFHGRSSLTTWLRAVMSQRHIDRLRAGRRLSPLPEDDSAVALETTSRPPDPERPRQLAAMRDALAGAVAALPPRDRLRLGCYYVQNLKLAAIGRMLGEHEATVSRHLTRTRGMVRDAVERCLRQDHGLDEAGIAECIQSVVDDAGSLDLAELVGADAPGPQERRSGSF